MLNWLGLRRGYASDEVPLWAGVTVRTRVLVGVVWLVVATAAYVLLNTRLPGDDGFGGFLPTFIAILVFTAGSSVTERGLIRVKDPTPVLNR